jgi:hypothetical protein
MYVRTQRIHNSNLKAQSQLTSPSSGFHGPLDQTRTKMIAHCLVSCLRQDGGMVPHDRLFSSMQTVMFIQVMKGHGIIGPRRAEAGTLC